MRRDKWLALLRNRISSRKKLRDRASKEAVGSRLKDGQERQQAPGEHVRTCGEKG